MKIQITRAALTSVAAFTLTTNVFAQEVPAPPSLNPAPTTLSVGARLYAEPTPFGMALAAALIKKHVPVTTVTDKTKAEFILSETSEAKKEGTGERIAKIAMLGMFAGSGKSFEATVTVANTEGSIVFAHSVKKGDFKKAAEDVANAIKKSLAS